MKILAQVSPFYQAFAANKILLELCGHYYFSEALKILYFIRFERLFGLRYGGVFCKIRAKPKIIPEF